ncbi:MAG TPA: hypothetical protein VF038_15770 [Usitatibacter sp.]
MPLRFAITLAALLAAAAPAHATPQRHNATDMWFDAAESGWGLNVIHQGNTLFGTLFVYGPDGQPTWYVAPAMVGGPDSYSGPLYSSVGTWFGLPTFDPATSTREPVGNITLDVGSTPATLDYTVGGVHVTKPVARFSFRRTDLTGLHRAYEYQPASGGFPELHHALERFAIIDDGATVTIDSSDDSEPYCSYVGRHGQDGQYESVSGTYSCGPEGASGQGSFSMTVDPSPTGFTGSFSGNGITSPQGRIAGALAAAPKMEGTGWRNAMWFVPSESGWGLNVIEQADTLFATLFVYDTQGKPHWYVASDLAQSGSTADGTAVNSGPLYEATGAYFGAASFDPSAVKYREVGTMSFQVHGPGTATLTYSVDNVTVTKNLASFTFARNDTSGTYKGQIADASGGHDPAVITIDDAGDRITMRIQGMYGGTCDYAGPSRQLGEAIYASGTVSCGFADSADFVLEDVLVSFDGITGRVELSNATGFVQDGLRSFNFAGARAN